MNEYSYLDLIEFAGRGRKLRGPKPIKVFMPGEKIGKGRPKRDRPPRKGPFTEDGVKRQWGPAVTSPQVPEKQEPEIDPLEQFQQEEFERLKERDLQPKADVLNQYLREHPEEINAYFRYASGNPDSTMEVQPFDFSREYSVLYDPELGKNIKYMSPYEYEEENRDDNPNFTYSAVNPDFNINIDNAFKKNQQFYEDYYWNPEDRPYMIPGEAFAEGIMNLKHQEALIRKRANQAFPPTPTLPSPGIDAPSIVGTELLPRKVNEMKHGGIYIKPENRGKFTATMKRTGKSAEELSHSNNPVTRKRAIFCLNARRWHHK